MNKEFIMQRAYDMKDWLRDLRRDFHMYPEPGGGEKRTSDKIKALFLEMGIEFKSYEGSTGVVGLIKGGNPGKTVAIRADMDALPIKERNDFPFRSKNEGWMHACGHDAHMTILLGTARYFAEIKESLKGYIKLLFQPAEESLGGAEEMVKYGCMKEPEVDYVIGLHVEPYLSCGIIETKYGALNGSSDDVLITIKGSKAHGAYPENGTDAIVIAAQVINSLQMVASRNVSPLDSIALTIGMINGGTASNIIADEVEMRATLRTINPLTRKAAKQRIREIVYGVSAALGGGCNVEIREGYDALVNDDEVVDIIIETSRDLFGNEGLHLKERPSLGVEDFSYFINASKGAFYHLGCGNIEKGITKALHTDEFDIDEECLPRGVMMHVAIALKLLES